MNWILFIILGTNMPILHQVNRYASENGCRAAITELTGQGVRAVCLFKQESK